MSIRFWLGSLLVPLALAAGVGARQAPVPASDAVGLSAATLRFRNQAINTPSAARSVTYNPTIIGSRTGQAVVTESGANSLQTVSPNVTGVQPAIQLSTTSLTFGDQGLGTTSFIQEIFVITTGTTPVTITSITASGDFAETSNCPLSPFALDVPEGQRCNINVTFTPTTVGPRTGTITVNFNGAGSPQTASLSGTGSDLNLQPGGLVFGGDQALATTSAPQTVTVTNLSSAAATISSIQTTGDYSQTNNCPSSLPAGQSCTITVTFAPTAVSFRSGEVVIDSNLPESPDTISLTGFGTVLKLVPERDFFFVGRQTIGTTSHPRTVTLTNTGNSPVTFSSIQIMPDPNVPSSSGFAETDDCGSSLAAGASCAITVTFSPTAPGFALENLTVDSSAPDSPQTVRLEGIGVVLFATPDFLSFNSQAVGSTSAPKTATVQNTSKTNSVTISSVTASTDYAETNNCSTLAPGGSCTISATFTPSVTGPDNGTLTINDNAADNPVTVSLSGTGSFVSLSPSSLSFSEATLNASSAPQTVTLVNRGTTPLTINAIGATGDYSETNGCPSASAALAPNANCTIQVTFTPTLFGTETGSLAVSSSDPGSPNIVALQGSGPSTTFADTDVFVGVPNIPGNARGALTGTVERFSATGKLLQKLDNGLPGSVTTGMAFDTSSNLYVTDFAPSTVSKFDDTGALLQTFGIEPRGELESILFEATGNAYTGAADGDGAIRKFDTSGNLLARFFVATENRGTDWIDLAQDQCTVYYTSEGQNVKRFNVCTNTQLPDFTDSLPGRAAFSLRLIPTGGLLVADTQQIVRLDSSGNIVQIYRAPGENFWFGLNLDPDGTSFWSAGILSPYVYRFNIASGAVELKLNTDAFSGVSGLVVKGEITAATAAIEAIPAVVTFGDQTVGAKSPPQNITVTNTTSSPATISSVTLAGANPGDFVIASDTCPGVTLSSGATCAFDVSFAPQVTGPLAAQVEIASNAPGSPQTVSLTGTGVAPAVTLSPIPLTFSDQTVGTTSPAQAVTLSNSGDGPLSISSIAITGTDSSDFAQTNNCPISPGTLAAAGTCTIMVTFTPTAAGLRTGAVTVTDNAQGSPQAINLSGTGVTPGPPFTLTPAFTTLTVPQGLAVQCNVAVAPAPGFTGTVAFACSVDTQPATCTISPATMTLNGETPFTTTFTVDTVAGLTMAPPRGPGHGWPPLGSFGLLAWLALLLALATMAALRKTLRPRMFAALAALVLVIALCGLTMTSCGGAAGGPGTPLGSHTVTVTGTSGSQTQTAKVTLIVK